MVGANYLVSQLVFGDMTLEESTRSIGLFASHVMPVLRGARGLSESTTAPKTQEKRGRLG
jgi:hypothetical protein